MRQNNNYVPEFTDEEVMTLYLFGIHNHLNFNWLNKKTQIQNATKVRSSKGLLVQWGKLAAALASLTKIVFNP